MKFYTYVGQFQNKIYVRNIDSKGEEYSEYVPFEPTLYVPCPPEKSTFKSLDGKPLAELSFPTVNSCKEFLQQYDDVVNYPIRGVKNFTFQYISEKYPDIQWDESKISIYTIDIEVASDDGFPDIRLANAAITSLTIHNSINDVYYVFGTGEYTPNDPEKTIKYFRSDNEEEMMQLFLDWWKDNPPHIVTGWNCKFFDIPFIVNRLKYLDLEYKYLSPIKKVFDKNVVIAGRDNQYYSIIGVSVLDYLDLYRKYTYKNQESYKLDYIGQVELGMGKVIDEDVEGYNLYKTDYQKFIEYNIRDVEIVKKLDDKMKLLYLLMTIAYDSKINFEDVFSPVRTWESIIYNFLKDDNIAPPLKKRGTDNKSIEGGYVKEPALGLHKWVVSFDLNSLYPHLIQQYNISPETISHDEVLKIKYRDGVNGLLNKEYDTEYLKEMNVTLTPNGQHFTTKFQGFLPKLMKSMYDDRVIYKKKMLVEEQRLEDGNYKNKQEVVNNISKYNNAQMAKKILLNSAYGALANQYFLYYSPEQAEAVTMSGQLSIRWIEKDINKFINDLLKTGDTDYVIASDTDSVYITFDKLVNEVWGEGADTEKVITFLDKMCKDKIEPHIDSCYQTLHAYVNSYEQKMVMKRESIADKGIWTAKKRYILNVYDSEGVRYKEPKLKVMGIESVRSSTPKWCRENIQSLIKTIINTDEQTVIKAIEDFRAVFKTLTFKEIAFPRGVKGLSKYKSSKDIYIKATPIHVRGTLLFNHQLRERNLTKKYQLIRDGEKIKFAYLKEPNILGENVIAIATVLPKEFDLERFIDYDLQFDKSFLQPCKNILDAIGWKSENISSLESFFG
jgi:DNA polymerase elongation subunit (family B)